MLVYVIDKFASMVYLRLNYRDQSGANNTGRRLHFAFSTSCRTEQRGASIIAKRSGLRPD